MAFTNAYIPYGSAWSTPFSKWQGSLASMHPLKLAAQSSQKALERAGISAQDLEAVVVGWTVPSPSCFYGAPWLAAMIGAPHITGTMVSQACATGARAIATAATMVEQGQSNVLVSTSDRCSNGPHLYYPDPTGPGGKGQAEDWVWDNFSRDPYAKNAMIETAENVAREAGVSRETQDDLTQLRFEQYQKALSEDRAFQKRYFIPADVTDARGQRILLTLEEDEGVFPTSRDGLAKLKPLMTEGTVTFGSQTHPADGNAGLVVTTQDKARALGKSGVMVRVASYAEARTKKGFMAMAVVPAAQKALDAAGFSKDEVLIKTHNPFAVNDVYLARELGLAPESFNDYGSSLIFGHPQGPTGVRLVAELIEQLVMKGGGRGLFVGCAAGDTAAGITLEVTCS